ncbi:translation elongation factor 2 (EF-2/EF-G) [Alteromonadaceae bacterium 2753L.S.0a.02]|nr:translation elongation factor 2 (EF-2/EF-G) [Alteromonadaceae bacterium 2753L.S.0a.02]
MNQTISTRNIAFAGHAGSGKTSLIERILFETKAIPVMGELERGTTVSDSDEQSKALQHSVETSICSFDYNKNHVNLIDTPGYPDFVGRTISILPAVESVAVVIDANAGIEMVTERIMEVAAQRKKCRLIVVNKIDALEYDVSELINALQAQFGNECLPLNLPTPGHESVVDCYFEPVKTKTEFCSVTQAHDNLVDQVVEVDEELMALYLEQGEDLSPEQLHDPFEKALRSQHLVPICFVSARTGAGIDQLLRVLSELMPNPTEGNTPLFLNGEKPISVTESAEDHVLAHVFKVSVDPFMGRVAYLRVHQGTLTPESQLYIGEARKTFKVAHLFKVQGAKRDEIAAAIPGDICAIAKVEDAEFDTVLHDSHDDDHIHLKSLAFPAPMYGLAVRPTRRGDEQRLSDTLKKLAAEDPSLRIEHRVNLNETVIHGVGEFHLRIVLEKMEKTFNVTADTQQPTIDYRETITKPAKGHFRHKKQTGGAGQFGEVYLEIEPLERGEGFEFVDKVVGGVIPGQFIPAVEKGVRQILEEGAVAGFPLQDVRVSVYDGKHHPVDSKEIAFVAAGRKAFLDAITKADAIVLEPIVNLSILAPASAMGDITGDISSHRGVVTNATTNINERVQITARMPLAEIFDYQSRIKSMTGGEGSFTVEFSRYDPAPPKQQQALSKDFKVAEFAT